MIIVLLTGLVLLLLMAYKMNNNEMSSPAFVFCASFVFMVSYAASYTSRWQTQLHFNTMIMVLLYVAEFVFVCLAVHDFMALTAGRSVNTAKETEGSFKISEFKKTVLLLVSILIVYAYIRYICNKTGLPIITAIGRIYGKNINLEIPAINKVLNLFVKSLGFWFSYPIAYNFVIGKRIDWISIGIMLVSAASTMLGGTRGVAVCMFVSLLGVLLLLYYKKSTGAGKVKFRYIVLVVAVFIIVIRNFSAIGNLMGRKTSIDSEDYSAAYCGAEIYNLDTFLNSGDFENPDREVWGRLTFGSIEKTLSKYGIIDDIRTRRNYSPYRKSNGIFMGNVYTFFYSSLYDFGYVGTALFVAAVALVFQIIYEKARDADFTSGSQLPTVLFGYCFPLVFFAFFSNWVTGNIVCTGFVWNLVFWIILDFYFFRINLA